LGQFIRNLCSLQSFWRQLKRPSDYQRDWKPDDNYENNQPDYPVGDFEKRKDLGRNLNQQPCDDCVCDRNFVNIAPLQLREKVVRIHSARLDQALVTPTILLGCAQLEKRAKLSPSATAYAFI
jgi:hypothetical protein